LNFIFSSYLDQHLRIALFHQVSAVAHEATAVTIELRWRIIANAWQLKR